MLREIDGTYTLPDPNVNKNSVKQIIDILYPAECEKKYGLYKEIEERYKEAYKTIEIYFLTEENKKLFGERYYDIVKSIGLQVNIDSLGNSEKALLTKIFPLVSNDNNWNEYLSSVLSALKSKRYTKLISELNKDEELECNYDKILKILISDPQNIKV